MPTSCFRPVSTGRCFTRTRDSHPAARWRHSAHEESCARRPPRSSPGLHRAAGDHDTERGLSPLAGASRVRRRRVRRRRGRQPLRRQQAPVRCGHARRVVGSVNADARASGIDNARPCVAKAGGRGRRDGPDRQRRDPFPLPRRRGSSGATWVYPSRADRKPLSRVSAAPWGSSRASSC